MLQKMWGTVNCSIVVGTNFRQIAKKDQFVNTKFVIWWLAGCKGERTVRPKALQMCTENINLQYKNNFLKFWSDYCWILW